MLAMNTTERALLHDGRLAARAGSRMVVVTQPGGARVGAMVRDPATAGGKTIASATIGALLAGGAIATYFFGYMWIAAGLMAGSLYLFVFRESDTITI